MDELPSWLEPLLDAETMRGTDRWAISERGVPGLELMENAGAAVDPRGRADGSGRARHDPLRQGQQRRRRAGRRAHAARRPAARSNVVCVGRPRRARRRRRAEPRAPARRRAAGPRRGLLDRARRLHQRGSGRCGPSLCWAHLRAGRGRAARDRLSGSAPRRGRARDRSAAPAPARDGAEHRRARAAWTPPRARSAATAVQASVTVTFHAAKPGLWINPGKAHAGTVEVADIGIPRGAPGASRIGLITETLLARAAAPVAPASTKFSSGHVLLAGGSRGLTGAPTMAARASMRAGAGYVTACVPDSLQAIARLLGVPGADDACASRRTRPHSGSFAERARDAVLEAAAARRGARAGARPRPQRAGCGLRPRRGPRGAAADGDRRGRRSTPTPGACRARRARRPVDRADAARRASSRA